MTLVLQLCCQDFLWRHWKYSAAEHRWLSKHKQSWERQTHRQADRDSKTTSCDCVQSRKLNTSDTAKLLGFPVKITHYLLNKYIFLVFEDVHNHSDQYQLHPVMHSNTESFVKLISSIFITFLKSRQWEQYRPQVYISRGGSARIQCVPFVIRKGTLALLLDVNHTPPVLKKHENNHFSHTAEVSHKLCRNHRCFSDTYTLSFV